MNKMNENPKSRGVQHLKNKSKHKKTSKGATLKNTQKQKRCSDLENNWDRYEDDTNLAYENYPTVGADFSVLSNAPISKGSYFQFKSDATNKKDIESYSVHSNGLFQLDLNMLGLSIASIPFIDRCSIPKSYFSDTQLTSMSQLAKYNTELYVQALLKEKCTSQYDNKFSVPHHQAEIHKSSLNKLDLLHSDEDNIERNIPKTTNLSKTKENRPSLISETKGDLGIISKPGPLLDNVHKHGVEDLIKASASSILETESLEKWLDDVLKD